MCSIVWLRGNPKITSHEDDAQASSTLHCISSVPKPTPRYSGSVTARASSHEWFHVLMSRVIQATTLSWSIATLQAVEPEQIPSRTCSGCLQGWDDWP